MNYKKLCFFLFLKIYVYSYSDDLDNCCCRCCCFCCKKNTKENYNFNLENNIKGNAEENIKGNAEENIKGNAEENIGKPKGLYNIGLTCYMNSLLQCSYYIPELRNYFIGNKDKFSDKQPVCKAFAEVMYGLKYNENYYFTPTEFKKIMGNKNNLFKGIKAADVKDLYFNFIDSLLDELNQENKDNDENEENDIDLTNKEAVFKEAEKEVDKNIINQLLIGYYETIYNCKNKPGGKVYSFSSESFILFNLENISNYYKNRELSINDCLEYNFNRRYETSFYCSECKKIESNMSEDRIYRPPEILVLILDRGKGKAFKGKVEITKELELKDYIDEENFEKKYSNSYKLICVATHSGSSSASGHYTARCLADNNKFYYFSDSNVKEINDDKELFTDEPYLLFYKQDEAPKKENNNENKDKI